MCLTDFKRDAKLFLRNPVHAVLTDTCRPECLLRSRVVKGWNCLLCAHGQCRERGADNVSQQSDSKSILFLCVCVPSRGSYVLRPDSLCKVFEHIWRQIRLQLFWIAGLWSQPSCREILCSNRWNESNFLSKCFIHWIFNLTALAIGCVHKHQTDFWALWTWHLWSVQCSDSKLISS